MSTRIDRTVALTVCDEDGYDIETVTLALEIDCTPGEPEFAPHGHHTDPEHYDPGSGAEAHLRAVWRVEDGQRTTPDKRELRWAAKWLEQHVDGLEVEGVG